MIRTPNDDEQVVGFKFEMTNEMDGAFIVKKHVDLDALQELMGKLGFRLYLPSKKETPSTDEDSML